MEWVCVARRQSVLTVSQSSSLEAPPHLHRRGRDRNPQRDEEAEHGRDARADGYLRLADPVLPLLRARRGERRADRPELGGRECWAATEAE